MGCFRATLVALAVALWSTDVSADQHQQPSDLVLNLTAALQPILDAKSTRWAHSGMVLGFRRGNDTFALAAGYNDMAKKVKEGRKEEQVVQGFHG